MSTYTMTKTSEPQTTALNHSSTLSLLRPSSASGVAAPPAGPRHEGAFNDRDSAGELQGDEHAGPTGATSEEGGIGEEEGAVESAVPRDEVFLRDVQVAFAAQPDVRPTWEHSYLKLLVVGESGMGKTTFVRNVFASYAQSSAFPVADASEPTALSTFVSAPEKLCTEVLVRDEVARHNYHYLVQDTPGYGDKDTPVQEIQRLVMEYISANNRRFLEAEVNPSRTCPMSELPDPRVDAVLFFIAPHRLKQIEIDFMAELSRVVPVVPLLAKADSMTAEELQDFRALVRQALGSAGKGVMHRFSAESLDEACVRRGCPPFAVVGSNKSDMAVGNFWPVRTYPWGRCEAMSSRHSDVPGLRRLLLEVSYQELKTKTEERFYQYRRKHSRDVGLPETGSTGTLGAPASSPGPVKLLGRALFGLAVMALASLVVPPFVGDVVEQKKGKVVRSAEAAIDNVTTKARETREAVEERLAKAVPGVTEPSPPPPPEPQPLKKRGWFSPWASKP